MRQITYSQAIREALTEEMERNSNIILLGEDIGIYGGVFKVTDGLLDRFGNEQINRHHRMRRCVQQDFFAHVIAFVYLFNNFRG